MRTTALEEPMDIPGQVEVASPVLLKKLRESVHPPGKKGTWLRHLNDKRLLEVYFRLRKGQEALTIAKVAQREWGVMRHSKAKSIARAIRRLRNDTVGLLQILPQVGPKDQKKKRQVKADYFGKAGKKIVAHLDGLGRLRWAIDVQTDRIVSLRERERAALPFKFTDKAMEVLTKMIDLYLSKQIELGLLDTKPQEFSLEVKHRFHGLMQHSMTGGGAGVTAAMGKFLEMAEDQALTFELDANGNYVMSEEERYGNCPQPGKNYTLEEGAGDGLDGGEPDGAEPEGDEDIGLDDLLRATGRRKR